ncbi:hypothetical protein [Paenibacillus puerhi]|uniref:hypothetical protein n=1 Tax=Paenibacillus puerhi TaxID=2692622 RepID=UPI00135B5060|nr:hypothetical protein [Paenibacillus puerhi]
MNEYAKSLKQTLISLIREMAAAPAPYVKNPEKDFFRKKKLPFETVMQLLISMGGNSLYKELLESQGYDVNTATTSAFVQQRNKAGFFRTPMHGRPLARTASLAFSKMNSPGLRMVM